MIPKDKIKDLVAKYYLVEKELSLGEIDPKTYAKKSKEYSDLKSIVNYAKEYLNFDNEKEGLDNIAIKK